MHTHSFKKILRVGIGGKEKVHGVLVPECMPQKNVTKSEKNWGKNFYLNKLLTLPWCYTDKNTKKVHRQNSTYSSTSCLPG